MLPEQHGFPRKVKPLVRLGERETAAYCVLTGIDYIVEECPMAAGNRHLGYKELLNDLEDLGHLVRRRNVEVDVEATVAGVSRDTLPQGFRLGVGSFCVVP